MVKRLRTSQVEEAAVLFVERILNDTNWVSNRLYRDFGIDLHVKAFETSDTRRALPWEFHMQVKGTERLRHVDTFASLSIDTVHLCDWYEAALPVLLIVCNVSKNAAYYLWVREYIDALDSSWQEQKTMRLRIPLGNQFTHVALLKLVAHLKRVTFRREAHHVMARLQQARLDNDDLFDESYQPLGIPDESIDNPALAQCILCRNYFWIDEALTVGCDIIDDGGIPLNCEFTRIYQPWGHQPTVYSCDAPEEHCPICLSDRGMLAPCTECGRYQYPLLILVIGTIL
jgi:hypothetical protein